MNKVLILYPNLFNCYSKFSRKVGRIISRMGDTLLIYSHDPNDLIKRFCEENLDKINFQQVADWNCCDITHAIIFDDGEEFMRETALLKSNAIPMRLIKIDITRVINIKRDTEYQSERSTPDYEYIGRGSYWGNPYSMFEEGEDRDEVIRKYKYDFEYEKFPNKEKKEVYKLAGKRLGCFCKPESCHGDVLADFLNQWDDGK